MGRVGKLYELRQFNQEEEQMLKDGKALIDEKTITSKMLELKSYFKQRWKDVPEETAEKAGKTNAYHKQNIMEHLIPAFGLCVVALTLLWEMAGLKNICLAVIALASFIALLIYLLYISSNRKKIFSDNLVKQKTENILKDLDKYFDRPDDVFADGDEKLQVMIDSLEDENKNKNRRHDTVSSVFSAGAAVGVGFLQIILDVFKVDPFNGPDYLGIIFTLIMMCPVWVYLIIDIIDLFKGDWLGDVLLRHLKLLRANRHGFASDDLEYLNQYYDKEIMHNADLGTEDRITKTEQYAVQLLNVGRRFLTDGDCATALMYFKSSFQAMTVLESSLCEEKNIDTSEVTALRELLLKKTTEAEKMNSV